MKPEQLLALMEETATKAGVEVRYDSLDCDDLRVKDGICRFGDRLILFIHKSRSATQRVEIIRSALRGRDLTGIYLKPAVRMLLEEREED